jgi:heme exporter protein B
MSLGGLSLTPALAAVILWVVIFFSAMAGLSRVFTKELETGTLFTLKVYASAQTVLFGKLMFNLLMLAGLIVLIIPLFVMFFAVEINSWPMLTGVLLLGGIGIAAVSTLTASIAVGTEGSGALFTVISFPLLIPLLLTATRLTNAIFAGTLPEFGQLIVLIGYDVTVIVAVSILFDFLW